MRIGIYAGAALGAALAVCATAVSAADYAVQPVPDDLWAVMQDTSWHEGIDCPAREDLALVAVRYEDFEGAPQSGHLIVAAAHAEEIGAIFQEIWQRRLLRFARIEPVSFHGGSDAASMAANNTSAFNCRTVTGGTRLSEHSYGAAIDINPIQNPYVRGDRTLPPQGSPYDDPGEREAAIERGMPGLVTPDVVAVFATHGWSWGGDWTSLKDYQHCSKSGN